MKIIACMLLINFFAIVNAQCTGCTVTNPTLSGNYTFSSGSVVCFTSNATLGDVTFQNNSKLCVAPGVTVIIQNNINMNTGDTVTFEVGGTLQFNQSPQLNANMRINVQTTGILQAGATGTNNFTFNGSGTNIFTNAGKVNVSVLGFNASAATNTVDNLSTGVFNVGSNVNISGTTTYRNQGIINLGASYNNNATSTYINCGTINSAGANINGGKIINTGTFNLASAGSSFDWGNGGRFYNYGLVDSQAALNTGAAPNLLYNEGLFKIRTYQGGADIQGPTSSTKKGYFEIQNQLLINGAKVGPNLDFKLMTGTSSQSTVFNSAPSLQPTAATANVTYDCRASGTCSAPVVSAYTCPNLDGTFPPTTISTDIAVNKTGPYSVSPNGTVTYKIYVTNNGTADATNVILTDPAVANLTVSSVTCSSGDGVGGSASCPGTVTVAALQGTGLIIPSLPVDSGVVFTVTGTASASGVINNTATVSLPTGYVDTDNTNNSSTVSTEIFNACTTSTYTLNFAKTIANNTVAINGGTINLYYDLSAGTAISGIGNTFTIPVTYSDFINTANGTDNQWVAGSPSDFVGLGVSILPNTSNINTIGSIYNNLPAPKNTNYLPASYNSISYLNQDLAMSQALKVGDILPLGHYSITIGNYPALPAGVKIVSQSFPVSTSNNAQFGTTAYNSGYLAKPLIQTAYQTNTSGSTLTIEMQPGQKYYFRYTAFTGDATPIGVNNGNRGLIFRQGSVTFSVCATACYNPVTNTAAGLPVNHGVTLLKRAGAENGNWPMIRKSAYTALESNSKAFVITRMTSDPAQTAAANHLSKITNPVEGMMVYDTFSKCLKIYNDGVWSCFSTASCP